MIYSTEQDARRGNRLHSVPAVWQLSGSTSVGVINTMLYSVGEAMPTLVMYLSGSQDTIGTSINKATPFTVQAASARVQEFAAPFSAGDMLNFIRTTFRLNIKQLAQTLLVDRVTVYAWLKIDSMASLNDGNRNRLLTLYRIAQIWKKFAPLSGNFLLEILPDYQKSLMDLLTHPILEPMTFHHAYEQLAKATSPSIRASQHRVQQRSSINEAVQTLQRNLPNLGLDLS